MPRHMELTVSRGCFPEVYTWWPKVVLEAFLQPPYMNVISRMTYCKGIDGHEGVKSTYLYVLLEVGASQNRAR